MWRRREWARNTSGGSAFSAGEPSVRHLDAGAASVAVAEGGCWKTRGWGQVSREGVRALVRPCSPFWGLCFSPESHPWGPLGNLNRAAAWSEMLSKDLSGCYFEKTEEARSTRRPLYLSKQDVLVLRPRWSLWRSGQHGLVTGLSVVKSMFCSSSSTMAVTHPGLRSSCSVTSMRTELDFFI